MAPPAPSMFPDSTRCVQVRCERSAAERSPRNQVQIEKGGSPEDCDSSAARDTRPTGDSRDAVRASEGAIRSTSADLYTDPPFTLGQGRAHLQERAVDATSLPGSPGTAHQSSIYCAVSLGVIARAPFERPGSSLRRTAGRRMSDALRPGAARSGPWRSAAVRARLIRLCEPGPRHAGISRAGPRRSDLATSSSAHPGGTVKPRSWVF